MKKILFILAISISSLAGFAGETNVDTKVLNAFNREFAGAKDVKWSTNDTYYKASFVINGQYVCAFYKLDGDLMAITRNISSLDLPLNLQQNLKNTRSGYWITDLFEISNNEGTSYYITMENADSRVILKSTSTGTWNEYNKSVKI